MLQQHGVMQSTNVGEHLPNGQMTRHYPFDSFPTPGQLHPIYVEEVCAASISQDLIVLNPAKEMYI